jgi:hypothetical protein
VTRANLGALAVDLPKLLETRLLVQANSGGGKSHLLRRLLEQTASSVQQLVVDPEGEFSSLRERFDFIICAPRGGDAVADPSTAAALARALWESGASAIIDIYELKAHERTLFVKRFIEALVNAPKKNWHPTLVVIDEIHIFAPQTGSAESTGAVIDLATRGRKRGLALIGATQRLSKLHKDVAAELLNKLVGRTGLDIDVARAADELGMTKTVATTALRNLRPGEFFAYGPALSQAPERTIIGPVTTTHPKTGGRLLAAPPPPSDAILAKLAKLEGIQVAAEEEAGTIESLSVKLTDAKREIARLTRAPAGIPEAEVQRRIREAVAAAPSRATGSDSLSKVLESARKHARNLTLILEGAPIVRPGPALKTDSTTLVSVKITSAAKPSAASALIASGLTGPEQRILDAIAWLESVGIEAPEQPAVAFLAGYKFGGGAYNNPRGKLNVGGLVEYLPGGAIRLTTSGRSKANFPDSVATNEELHARVLARLGGPEKRLLQPLLEAYPDSMSNEELANAAGYSGGGGAFNNPRGRLRTLGLIEYRGAGQVAARALLFPQARK